MQGVYRVAGSTSEVTAAIDALVFNPTPHLVVPSGTVATNFTIRDIDTALRSAIDTSRTVVALASTTQPTISGAVGGQTTANQGTINPFAPVQIADVNFGQTETVTVTLSTPANGTLTNLGGGSYDAASGVYAIAGNATAVSTALDDLVFLPTAALTAPAQIFTRFTIGDIDTAGQSNTDSNTTVTNTTTAVALTISGTAGGQAVADQGTISPFASVVIGDANAGQTETVTVTMSAPGNGTLTNLGVGTYNPQTGAYSVTGPATVVTFTLRGWVFTPTAHQVAPGQTVTTTFAITDTDTASQSATNGATTVIATAGTITPTISFMQAGLSVSDQGTIDPFSNVVIGDLNVGQTETLTVALSVPANGTLADALGGTYNAVRGSYTDIGSLSAVTAALQDLIFTPTTRQVAPGQTVTTTFTITDTDTALATAIDSTTTVIATAGTVAPTITGTLAGQPISDQETIIPFANVVIGDINVGQTETVTVSLSQPANGTLTNLGGGSYNPQTGAYSITGSTVAVMAALKAWVFTPIPHQVIPGATVTTDFTISDTDTALATASDATTSVIATAGTVAPTISGIGANPPISDQATIAPFANLVITDLNVGQTETVTVSLLAANGSLTNLGGGIYNPQTGVYSLTASAAAATSTLKALVFTPTPHQVLFGQSVTTTFAISDTDSVGRTATDSATAVVVNATAAAPTISGAVPGQTISDQQTITPIANVLIADANAGQTETVTVTLSANANGTLTDAAGGSTNPVTGVYTDTGTPTAVTAALAALVFTPTAHQVAPGNAVTTSFTIGDTNTAQQTATDSTTTVIATAAAVPPTIGGTATGQSISDQASISPFAHVVIADVNFGQTETVTLTLSAAANGTLTSLGGGSYTASSGVYTVTGSAPSVTAAVDALKFIPTRAQVAGGQTVTTGFNLSVTDTAGAGAINTATRVVTTAVTPPAGEVILSGSSTQYVIANDGGTLYVQDTVAGRNGTQVLPGITVMSFTNGMGLFDPTGTAEDVARLYQAALNRAPDLSGVQFWTGLVDGSNVPLSAVAGDFTTSLEFIQDYGTLSDSGYVQQLYLNVLSRPADAAGLQDWDGALASGSSRGSVLLGFAESPEFDADTLPIAGAQYNAEAYRLYTAALNRPPDASGQTYWAGQLANGVTPTQVAQGFISSAEFIQDYGTLSASAFVTVMYENVLHRAPDSAGQQYWTNVLFQGVSEAGVLVGFSDSLENRAQTAGATHANWVFTSS